VEILPNRIRLRRDPALELVLTAAGGKLMAIEAPFEPEGGAYTASTHSGHDPHHRHDHDDHDHAHGGDHGHAHRH
jgi:urease accessory protein